MSRGKKILIMDDEELVRSTTAEMLAEMGFSVDEAINAPQAISLYDRSLHDHEPYDLVILDLSIPGEMGGKECFARLRELDPDITAIVASGYCNDPIIDDFTAYGFRGVVTKPYSFDQLGATVTNVINGPPRPHAR
jgi:CheY-like chemotaxis protein